MIVFFSEKLQPWKTKLNKLLFYSDFIMFKQTGFSMSGVQYRAIPMGPVPNNFNSIFEYLINKNELSLSYINFDDGGTGEQFRPGPNKTFNMELFTDNEMQVLELVADRFKNTSTNQIIEISHNEKAWRDNIVEKKLLDYNYSFDLSLI